VHPALGYLAVRSILNSIAFRLRRLRQPRYLLVAVFGVLYFGMMIVNRRHVGGFAIPPGYEGMAQLAVAGMIAAGMALTWIVSGTATLRFTLADVQFLFPAPLPRRALLTYKIVRLMLGATAAPVFIALVAGPVQPVAALVFYLKVAAIMMFVALHEAGVSLYRLNAADEGGLTGGRRVAVIITDGAIVIGSTWLLTRFAFAGTREFLAMVPLVAIATAALVSWILRSDAAFEEQATSAAEKMRDAVARVQRVQPSVARVKSTPFRLAPKGPVETAILWKNWMLLSRTSGRQWLVIASISVPMVIGVAAFAFVDGDPAGAAIGFVIAACAALFGPVVLRVDLRQDLGNLVMIKTWPVAGPAIVRGEVLAPAIALSTASALGAFIAALFLPPSALPAPGFEGRAALFAVTTLVAGAAIVAQLVVQNGVAALFPAWVRITPGAIQPGSIELMGQSTLVMYGGMIALIAMALVPAAVAALIRFGAGGIVGPAAVFALLLLVESYAATEIIGRLLDRVDLRDVSVAQ
jgi:hypothetical protein